MSCQNKSTPTRSTQFVVRTDEGSVILCTRFEADSLICSKVVRGPKISKLGHVTPTSPTYGSFYGPYAGSVRLNYRSTKFEAGSSVRSKVIRGSKTSKLGHLTSATPTFGSIYGQYTGRFRPLCTKFQAYLHSPSQETLSGQRKSF